MPRPHAHAVFVCLLAVLAACTGRASPPDPSPSFSPPPGTSYGGLDVVWPTGARGTPAPPALGAIVTTAAAPITGGRALEAGLTLPRVGGTSANPTVMTPCGKIVRLAGGGFTARTRPTSRKLVVLDPGHGGREKGALGTGGVAEKTRNLQIATLVARDLGPDVDVVLTRTTDQTTRLGFRVALADAVRADLAVSIHFNAGANNVSPEPGTETFGSIADPNGRRVAGVMFEAERRYLDTLKASFVGRWAANTDAGARYRLGSNGDFYRQLRTSHVAWVISEALFISNPPEARLLARAPVRAGLAHAIATGVRTFLFTDAPGSGWREPARRGDPDPAAASACRDPIT